MADNPLQNDDIDSIEDFIQSESDSFCGPKYIKSKDLKKYLGIVDIPDSYYRWEIEYTQEELKSILKTKLNLDIKYVNNLIPLKRGLSGRIIELIIDYTDITIIDQSIILASEHEIRYALHQKFLYSSAFIIEQENNNFKLSGAGWGHGVGLCQVGALGMALNGFTASKILKHYFKGTEIKKMY